MNRRTNVQMAAILAGLCVVSSAGAQIAPSSPTTSWTVVELMSPSVYPDPVNDHQTGSAEADIVGDPNHGSFYTKFYDGGTADNPFDGQLAFRIRISEDKNPAGYTGCVVVGMDLDLDGSLDVFAGVNNSGSKDHIGLWTAGSGANISPSTTTIASTARFSYTETAANYSWQRVTTVVDPGATILNFDAAKSGPDYFVSFVIPFADLVAMAQEFGLMDFSQESQMSYVAATATQGNSLNQDLNGVDGGIRSDVSWLDLGAMSAPGGIWSPAPVPEPGFLALAAGGLGCLLAWRGRKARPSLSLSRAARRF